ncbi:conserved hypothetical protein [Candidatus Defluviicoccus seviourii]|uniref:Transcriptional regulator n=1 Tax=Candidatus Defluviicoccus seviourii TaxID=2565273 RepID=A0A564WJR3_9PROT|nr:conserved hypothetical protein [Candidatus Defluviicoccus seviourii]
MSATATVPAGPALARAAHHWGADLPDWVAALAVACDAAGSQAGTAARVGYSGAVVSQVLKRDYRGSYDAVEAAVRARIMGATVDCPVLGQILLEDCHNYQRAAGTGARESTLQVRLARACPACPQRRA